MPYTYNDQLIETVSVRRRRLVNALVHGRDPARRTWDERLVHAMIGVFIAALVCAGCVAYSFIGHLLANDPTLHPTQRPTIGATR